jgi:hypothetical protein
VATGIGTCLSCAHVKTEPAVADTADMAHVERPDRPPSSGGPTRIGSRTALIVLGAVWAVERLILTRWGVPLWSSFAAIMLMVALGIRAILVATESSSTSPLRPLTLIATAVAAVVTVLIALSDSPADRGLLLVWIVPVVILGVDVIGRRLPADALPFSIGGLLAIVVVAQLWLIWGAYRDQARADGFRNHLAQICAETAALPMGARAEWIAANESMLTKLGQLAPPDDERTRKLRLDLMTDLMYAEWSLGKDKALRDAGRMTSERWLHYARLDAGHLGIDRSCGVF